MVTRYVNTASTAGGNGTTNATVGANRAWATLREANTALSAAPQNDEVTVYCCGSVADAIDTGAIGDWTTASRRQYILGNPNESDGVHPGYWSTSHYRIDVTTNQRALDIWTWNAPVTISGIQVRNQGTGNAFTPRNSGNNCVFDSCIFIAVNSTIDYSIVGSHSIKNCISKTSTGKAAIIGGGGTLLIYNSIFTGGTGGIQKLGADVTVKNCEVFDTSDDFINAMTIDHCASDDGDGTNPVSVSNWSDEFYNASYISNVDFRLKSTSTLLDAGVGPATDTNVPTTDILGYARSGNTATVGPFEHEYDWVGCLSGSLHGSTGGQYWITKCTPSKHYVKYSRPISDYPGATGVMGMTGVPVQGITGNQGVQGSTGLQGAQGITGLGLDGVTGTQGVTGINGPTGIRGEKGVLPGVTGITSFGFYGGDTSVQVGYRSQSKLTYSTVFEAWETVLSETGTFVTEVSVGSYADWSSSTVLNTGTTGPHVIDGIKNNGTTVSWAGTTGAYGEYLQVKVLQSTVKQASIVLKHYEKR